MSIDDLPELGPIGEYTLVPRQFHSVERGGPFETCIDCDRSLTADGTIYMIERAFRRHETVFEYAICFACLETRENSLSMDSRRKIETHFDSRVDLLDRRTRLLREVGTDLDGWLASCLLCQKDRKNCMETQAYAICDGIHMLYAYHPWMVCGECVEEIAGLLSKQTIGEIERWTDEHLGVPPHLKDLLGDPVIIPF